jgi:two-component sensor histidine kinase
VTQQTEERVMIEVTKRPRPASLAVDAMLLMREFSHRINNEFASAIGTLSVAAARANNDETKAALLAVEQQLHSYAQVHQALQMPEYGTRIDASAYLRRLCGAISSSKLEGRDIKLVLVDREFSINSERCWRLGLIVSELITNAVRHAFRESGDTIRVELLPSSGFVVCCVTDNGAGEGGCRAGHGLKIIEALAESLDGKVDFSFGPSGGRSVLIFPLDA